MLAHQVCATLLTPLSLCSICGCWWAKIDVFQQECQRRASEWERETTDKRELFPLLSLSWLILFSCKCHSTTEPFSRELRKYPMSLSVSQAREKRDTASRKRANKWGRDYSDFVSLDETFFSRMEIWNFCLNCLFVPLSASKNCSKKKRTWALKQKFTSQRPTMCRGGRASGLTQNQQKNSCRKEKIPRHFFMHIFTI